MRVIPGSHRRGIGEHGKAVQAGNLLSVNQVLAVAREDEDRAVDIVLRAGPCRCTTAPSSTAACPTVPNAAAAA